MGTILTVLVLIAAVLLIVVVLLQPGKGDLSASFGGIGGQMGSMFGMQKTANILQKITIWIAIGILVLTFFINRFFLGGERDATSYQSVMNRNRSEVMKSITPQDVKPIQQQPQATQQNQQQTQQQPAGNAQPAKENNTGKK